MNHDKIIYKIFRNGKGDVIGYSGLIFELLKEVTNNLTTEFLSWQALIDPCQVSIKLNFTYVVREPSDGQFGVVRGGQWNGLIRCNKWLN